MTTTAITVFSSWSELPLEIQIKFIPQGLDVSTILALSITSQDHLFFRWTACVWTQTTTFHAAAAGYQPSLGIILKMIASTLPFASRTKSDQRELQEAKTIFWQQLTTALLRCSTPQVRHTLLNTLNKTNQWQRIVHARPASFSFTHLNLQKVITNQSQTTFVTYLRWQETHNHHIEVLDLRDNPSITQATIYEICEKIKHIRNLRELYLGDSIVPSGAIVNIARHHPKLTTLSLNGRTLRACRNGSIQQALQAIGTNLTQLERLELVTSASLFNQRADFFMGWNDASIPSNDLVKLLNSLPRLKHLNLNGIFYFDKQDFIRMAKALPHTLESMETGPVSPNPDWNIDDETAALFLKPNLKSLTIRFTYDLTETLLCSIGKKCPHLTQLALWRPFELSDRVLTTLSTDLPNLQTLHLIGIKERSLGKRAAAEAFTQWKNLTDLNLSSIPWVTENLLSLIATNTELEVLSLKQCKELYSSNLLSVATSFPRLRRLDISDQIKPDRLALSKEFFEKLFTTSSRLEWIDLSFSLITPEALHFLFDAVGTMPSLHSLIMSQQPAVRDIRKFRTAMNKRYPSLVME